MSFANAHHVVENVLSRIQGEMGLAPLLGAELEFYLNGAGDAEIFAAALAEALTKAGVEATPLKKEKSEGQYEIALAPKQEPLALAEHLEQLEDIATALAPAHGFTADFSAKPFADRHGSALHIHLNFLDAEGRNVFFKSGEDEYSDHLRYTLGGLLAFLPASMSVFAPHEGSYARFCPKLQAPTTVSWGANNRTTALRLPDTSPDDKRIEHRVPGADADPTLVIAAVLAGAHHGLANRIEPPQKIYGDAGLPKYNLPKLPASLEEAKQRAAAETALRVYGL